MMGTENIPGFLWLPSDVGRHRSSTPVASACGFRLRLPLVITACDYAPVNTHPVNTRIIFLRWYRRGGEGKEYEAKIEPIAPTTTALKNMLV